MRIAVIDLGTNTCNLLIAEISGKEYKILYQNKVGVKIGKAGINKKLLTKEAFERALKAIEIHKKTINSFGVEDITAIATSAVRDADNKNEFVDFLHRKTGIQLQVISGDEEARLIFLGVKLALGRISNESIILDIGGGSNEFIIPNKTSIGWKESFPLGMSRIIEQFRISNPILPQEISVIENHFDQELKKLWDVSETKSFNLLIGCSGAFDTLADLLDQTEPGSKTRIQQVISMSDFHRICNKIISSTKEQREQMTGMELLRIEMIVPSFIFIRLVAQKLKIKEIVQTDFALREGVLYEKIYN